MSASSSLCRRCLRRTDTSVCISSWVSNVQPLRLILDQQTLEYGNNMKTMLEFIPVDCISEGVGDPVGRLFDSVANKFDTTPRFIFNLTKHTKYEYSARFKAFFMTRDKLIFLFIFLSCRPVQIFPCMSGGLFQDSCNGSRCSDMQAFLRKHERVRGGSTIIVKKENCTCLPVGKYQY